MSAFVKMLNSVITSKGLSVAGSFVELSHSEAAALVAARAAVYADSSPTLRLTQDSDLQVASIENPRAFSPRGYFRPIPPTGALNNLTTNSTWTTKFCIPVQTYHAVRLGILNHQTNAVNNIKCIVAATEAAEMDTNTRLQRPIVGSTSRDAIDSTADMYGWRTVTVGGSSPFNLAAAAAADNPSVTWSDWVALTSVQRSDGANGSLILVRVYIPGATTNYAIITLTSGSQTPTQANRGFTMQTAWVSGNDAIAAPTTEGGPYATGAFPVMMQFASKDIAASVAFVGDSVTGNVSLVGDKFSNWGLRACGDVSSPSRAVLPINLGITSLPPAQYWARAQTIMANGNVPDVLVFSPWSPNAPPTVSDANSAGYKNMLLMATLHEFLRFCREQSIVPMLFTGLPMESAAAPVDALRRRFNFDLQSFGAATGVTVVDLCRIVSRGDEPETYTPELKFDVVHPNEAGIERMALAFRKPLASVVQRL